MRQYPYPHPRSHIVFTGYRWCEDYCEDCGSHWSLDVCTWRNGRFCGYILLHADTHLSKGPTWQEVIERLFLALDIRSIKVMLRENPNGKDDGRGLYILKVTKPFELMQRHLDGASPEGELDPNEQKLIEDVLTFAGMTCSWETNRTPAIWHHDAFDEPDY